MNGLKDIIIQKLDVSKADILKEVPNLNPEHYLTLVNLVIGHEMGKGIYAEVTLIYKNQKFVALEWTYPDYREAIAFDFFQKAREILKEQLGKEINSGSNDV